MSKLSIITKLFTFLLIVNISIAQNPSLVADVNTLGDIPGGSTFKPVESGGILYFGGYTNQRGLWKTDGTKTGTKLVKNFEEDPYWVCDVNGTLFFSAEISDAKLGTELWKTDGTPEGTVMVKDIYPGEEESYPTRLTNVNGTLYFAAYTEETGTELWKSDGTESGTVMVADLTPGEESTSFGYTWFDYNGALLFTFDDENNHEQLWISDGTALHTIKLHDFGPNSSFGGPDEYVLYNNEVLFAIYDATYRTSLWKTDGTKNGTVLVKDFDPSNTSIEEFAAYLTFTPDGVVMAAAEKIHGRELWISDGTTPGTYILKDIYAGIESSNPMNLSHVDGKVYFSAEAPGSGTETWVTDGTIAGTYLYLDIEPGPETKFGTSDFFGMGDKIIFNGDESEVWITDGTLNGTQDLSSSLITDQAGHHLVDWVMYKGQVYFTDNYGSSSEFWMSDGTLNGTKLVEVTPAQTNSSDPREMVKLNDGTYLFTADDGIHGDEIYVTDGTPSGTSLLADLYPGKTSSEVLFLDKIGGRYLFSAETPVDNTVKRSLWATDGTTEGTVKIARCTPYNFINPDPIYLAAKLNGVLYFHAYVAEGDTLFTLWRSDGTHDGTFAIKDINPQEGHDDIGEPVVYNNEVYFSADDGIHGSELWKTDGTTEGTKMVKDIKKGEESSNVRSLVSFNGYLYFFAESKTDGEDLWRSDGTKDGTAFFYNTQNPNSCSPGNTNTSGGLLYFTSTCVLWRTDGTKEGTFIIEEEDELFQEEYLDINGTMYVVDYKSVFKTKGLDLELVKEIDNPVGSSCCTDDMSTSNGDLYFINDDAGNGGFLWQSDGSTCRTLEIDLAPGLSDDAEILLVDGDAIFLALNSSEYGVEVFKYIVTPISPVEVCNGLDDDCNGDVDDNPIAPISPSGNINACKGEPVTLKSNAGIGLSYQWLKNGNPIDGATDYSYVTTKGGNYQVTVSGSSDCLATPDVTDINRLDNPEAAITPFGSLDICTTGSVLLEATGGSGFTYQWLKNGKIIPSATNQVFEATIPDEYKVEVTNSNGCSKASKKVVVYTSCKQSNVGLITVSYLDVYPNPTNGILNVRTGIQSTQKFAIVNLLGEPLLSRIFDSGEFSVDVSHLNAGVYLLRVENSTGITTKVFVKE